MRVFTSAIPSPQLPLLTPASPQGPDLERFHSEAQALVSWRDKPLQWWSVHGELRTARGRPLAFEVSFFDRRLQNDFFGPVPARWIAPRGFAAHFSIIDPKNGVEAQTYRYWQKGGILSNLSRFTGFAGEDRFHVEVGSWHVYETTRNGAEIRIFANGDGHSLHLDLRPAKKLAFHGQSGFIERCNGPEGASFYASLSRLVARGTILLGDTLEEVEGSAWLDHEKFSAPAMFFEEPWERISLQLPDARELMLFRSSLARFGSWIGPDGAVRPLIASDIIMEDSEYWRSPATNSRYPIKRRIKIPSIGLELDLRAEVADQERDTSRSAFTSYWSGLLSAHGSLEARKIEASGNMVAAGYDQRPKTRALGFLTGR